MTEAIDSFRNKDVSFADIRQESHASTQINVSNAIIRRFGRATKSGTVARALVGDCWGMSSTSEPLSVSICKELLSDAAKSAKANARFSKRALDLSNVQPIEKAVWQKCKLKFQLKKN